MNLKRDNMKRHYQMANGRSNWQMAEAIGNVLPPYAFLMVEPISFYDAHQDKRVEGEK